MADLIAVDDDEMVRDLIGAVVRRGGHAVRVAGDGAGLRRLDAERPAELVLLDQTLPGEDGIALARWLRTARPDVGIVLVSGQGDAVDRIAGLEAGADDYVAKPFAPAELLARIDAVLRRRRPQAAPWLGDWRIDVAAARLVHRDGRSTPVTAPELALLLALARNPGRVLSRDELLGAAPGRAADPFDRSIDQRVARLRLRLEDDPRHPALIRSVRGRGYLYRP